MTFEFTTTSSAVTRSVGRSPPSPVDRSSTHMHMRRGRTLPSVVRANVVLGEPLAAAATAPILTNQSRH